MPFSLEQLRVSFERATFNNQILLAVAQERPLVAEDFDKLAGEDLATKIGMDSQKKIYLALTHKEQKTLLSICLKNQDFVEQVISILDEQQKNIVNIVKDAMVKNHTDAQLLDALYSMTIDIVHKIFSLVAERVKRIPAGIFKKIVVAFFSSGINKQMLLTYMLEQTIQQLKKQTDFDE